MKLFKTKMNCFKVQLEEKLQLTNEVSTNIFLFLKIKFIFLFH